MISTYNNLNITIMTYTDLNINQKINFKSWFSDMLLCESVTDLATIPISDTCISAIEGERHPTKWEFK